MLFDESFLESIDKNPISGLVEACDKALDELSQYADRPEWSNEELEILMETLGLIGALVESHELDVELPFPELGGTVESSCKEIKSFVEAIMNEFQGRATELRIDAYKNRYQSALSKAFAYEFSRGDLERIQTLVNELRDYIGKCKKLESDHRQRLLKRLERLQSELHKRVSDLDRFWGMIGDAGVALGKLGDDAKPIVDRIKEISRIVWRTQARTEELPSDTPPPLLEQDEENL